MISFLRDQFLGLFFLNAGVGRRTRASVMSVSRVRIPRWSPGAASVLICLFTVGLAQGDYAPVLHERFEPDPKEDVAYGVRVTEGALPAALKSGGAVVPLPDPKKPITAQEPTYNEPRGNGAPHFRIDGQTSDPGRLHYHEPFRPSIAPFKRTHVYDAVDSNFELVVADGRARPVTMTAGPSDSADQFFGDLVLELKGEEATRIPSAGPGMKVYSANAEPPTVFGFYVDRAENWYVRAPAAKAKVRLLYHVGVERSAFDGRITATSYTALVSELPPVPPNVARVALEMARQTGVSRAMAPAPAIAELVAYFREFAESNDHLDATAGEALYRSLVTRKVGVCRHRAYAFVITALGLGIPSRFVHNEAHAWVEVFGGDGWHRIDLGGAASGIDFRGDPPSGKPHSPPSDPYRFPHKSAGATSSLTSRPNEAEQAQTPAIQKSSKPEDVTLQTAPKTEKRTAEQTALTEMPDAPPTGKIALNAKSELRVLRSHAVDIEGSIEGKRSGCGKVRIDLILTQRGLRSFAGSTLTDSDGKFKVKLNVPADLPVGDYELMVTSRGTKTCPAASSD